MISPKVFLDVETPPLEFLPDSFTCLEREQSSNVGEGEQAHITHKGIIPSFHLDIVDSPPRRLDAVGLVSQRDLLNMVVSARGLVVETSITGNTDLAEHSATVKAENVINFLNKLS